MTGELRLAALHPVPGIGFIFQALTFDMTRLIDADFKLQLAQIIDTGFAAAASSTALKAEVVALQGDGQPRVISFYRDERAMLTGLNVAQPTDGDSGAAVWTGPKGVNENDSPVALRRDLRIFIDPTGGTGIGVQMPDGSWRAPLWALAGTVWHELHHLATTKQHVEGAWPYSGAWAEAMSHIAAGFPPMMWDPLLRKMVTVHAQTWMSDTSTCGCRASA